MSSYALDELSWPEVRERLERDPRLMVPVGALNQHGRHLPLGANLLVADRVTSAVSDRLGVLRAPVFSYGVTTAGGPWPGSAGLRRKTLHRAVNELLARWEECGVREFILVTAHRYEPHLEALLMALSTDSTTTVYDLFQIDLADLVQGNPELEHGGELETSLLLHLAPDRVRRAEMDDVEPDAKTLRRYTRGRVPTPPRPPSAGSVGYPSRASEEKGAAVFERWVDTLEAAIGPAGGGSVPRPSG